MPTTPTRWFDFLLTARFWYTLLMLALAGLHAKFKIDNTSVWLGVAAAVPWVLPELQGMLKTFKAGSLFELEFRDKMAEQDQKIALNQLSIATGVGKMPPPVVAAVVVPAAGVDGVTNEICAAEDDAESPLETLIASDPNKGRFGSKPSADGLRLRAEVKPVPGSEELFVIHATISADRGRTLKPGTPITFYLHPTFPRPVVEAEVESNGIAALDRVAWGAFTIGAKVHEPGRETDLELDLGQDVTGAPAKFVSR